MSGPVRVESLPNAFSTVSMASSCKRPNSTRMARDPSRAIAKTSSVRAWRMRDAGSHRNWWPRKAMAEAPTISSVVAGVRHEDHEGPSPARNVAANRRRNLFDPLSSMITNAVV